MASLTGPLYSRVLRRVQSARATGSATSLVLVQQKVCVPVTARMCASFPGVYHIAVLAECAESGATVLLEHGPAVYDPRRELEPGTVRIALPGVRDTLEELLAFEATLPTRYLPGVRDCRHHVLDILAHVY